MRKERRARARKSWPDPCPRCPCPESRASRRRGTCSAIAMAKNPRPRTTGSRRRSRSPLRERSRRPDGVEDALSVHLVLGERVGRELAVRDHQGLVAGFVRIVPSGAERAHELVVRSGRIGCGGTSRMPGDVPDKSIGFLAGFGKTFRKCGKRVCHEDLEPGRGRAGLYGGTRSAPSSAASLERGEHEHSPESSLPRGSRRLKHTRSQTHGEGPERPIGPGPLSLPVQGESPVENALDGSCGLPEPRGGQERVADESKPPPRPHREREPTESARRSTRRRGATSSCYGPRRTEQRAAPQ